MTPTHLVVGMLAARTGPVTGSCLGLDALHLWENARLMNKYMMCGVVT